MGALLQVSSSCLLGTPRMHYCGNYIEEKNSLTTHLWLSHLSTVFSAVTQDGRIHVFDLYQNTYQAVCVQPVVQRRKAGLNRVAFNPTNPVVLAGDSLGSTHCLKLSPNLRLQSKEVKNALLNRDLVRAGELEVKKLSVLLAQVTQTDLKNDVCDDED